MTAAIHLHPTAPLADRVLLPGDPGRALALARLLLSEPKMFNHNRGLWGYTGSAADGGALTVQSTGIGGPSAAIVISELADLGARRLIRVGTCGALEPSLSLGDLVIVTESLCADGTSRALGAGDRAPASPALLNALTAAGEGVVAGPVVSTDLFYDDSGREAEWAAAGAIAIEMETATLFTLARGRELDAAAVLVVSDLLLPERVRITPDALQDAEHRMGALAASALGA